MADHINNLRWAQLGVLIFAILLMLSKTYETFTKLFSFFYETPLSIISVLVGIFAIGHGVFMIVKSMKAHKWYREIIEGMIVIAAGFLLLSPEFNTLLNIPFLGFMHNANHEFISHMAIALVPIVIVYFFDVLLRRE
jgi:uncharacterized membrane protein HdeD (DUF308 family)